MTINQPGIKYQTSRERDLYLGGQDKCSYKIIYREFKTASSSYLSYLNSHLSLGIDLYVVLPGIPSDLGR